MLDRNSALPLHQQVKAEIREKIAQGKYQAGERIPSTSELCADYGISTTPVRRAITELITEGILQGLPGKGTVVDPTPRKENNGRESKLVGVIFPSSTKSAFFLEIFHGIEDGLRGHGYHLVNTISNNDPEQEQRALIELREKGVEGMIVTPTVPNRTSSGDQTLREFLEQGFPLLFLDRKVPNIEADYISTDNETGGRRATQYLLDLGHRKIGFISCSDVNTVRERLAGYQRALSEAKVQINPLMIRHIFNQDDETAGYQAAMELLNLAITPTAIIASNDVIALGVYRACHEMDVDIPDDLSVVGYDNLFFTGSLNPPLTTIHQPKYEMGKKAGEIILRRLKGEKGGPTSLAIESRLIERGSCAKLNGKQKISRPLVAAEKEVT